MWLIAKLIFFFSPQNLHGKKEQLACVRLHSLSLISSSMMWPFLLFLILAGRGGSPGCPAAPGGPPREAAEWAKGGEGRGGGGPFSLPGCWHQRLQRAPPQGPGGSEVQREAATTGWETEEMLIHRKTLIPAIHLVQSMSWPFSLSAGDLPFV